MADNRRSSTRHDVNLDATMRVGDADEPCRIANLSMGGAYLAFRRLPMGQRVVVTFRVPTHDAPIAADATVRWSSDGGIGVQFDGLRAKETWGLGEFFKQLPAEG